MELKFELNTRLTVSCVVAVASAYGLVTVLIAFNSILLAFGNAVILLLILFVLFGWRELMGEFGKKRSATKQR
jgi:ABC-type transport system involved in cytochrome bd biosynthesis fused ATPase/permease subunit